MGHDEEAAAIDSLSLFLKAAGEPVAVLRRPDRDERNERAVDFEVAWKGTTVGVEVTSASAYMADFVEVEREQRVVDAFSRHLAEQGWAVSHQVEFCDLVAERQGERLFVEAKGRTAAIGTDVDTMYGQILRRIRGVVSP